MGEDIDTVLSRRRVPEPSQGFEARIIAEAARTPQDSVQAVRQRGKSAGRQGWWIEFWEIFSLPQPALVMSVVLLAGILIGAGVEGEDGGFPESDVSIGVVALDIMDVEGLS